MSRPLEIPYVVVDVFTRKRFGGNQLAVITDGRGLSAAQMQQIAHEFNFSETTFVLPASNPGKTAQVRIFNRTQEMPFAGHPNVGTAFVLGRQASIFGSSPGQILVFEEAAGLVEVSLLFEHEAVCGATITAPRSLKIGYTVEPAVIASCLSLDQSDIVLTNHPPALVSVGLPFVVAEVKQGSLPKARPNFDAFTAAAIKHSSTGVQGRFSTFAYARTGQDVDRLRARMFSPLSGTFEDPATGSASAALGAYLATLDPRADTSFDINIEQGVEMGRPSLITLQIRKTQNQLERVKISGYCVQTMRGVLQIE